MLHSKFNTVRESTLFRGWYQKWVKYDNNLTILLIQGCLQFSIQGGGNCSFIRRCACNGCNWMIQAYSYLCWRRVYIMRRYDYEYALAHWLHIRLDVEWQHLLFLNYCLGFLSWEAYSNLLQYIHLSDSVYQPWHPYHTQVGVGRRGRVCGYQRNDTETVLKG